MVNKFLKGDDSAATGDVGTDLGSKPDLATYFDFDSTELAGAL
jgi:hypothetical protein